MAAGHHTEAAIIRGEAVHVEEDPDEDELRPVLGVGVSVPGRTLVAGWAIEAHTVVEAHVRPEDLPGEPRSCGWPIRLAR